MISCYYINKFVIILQALGERIQPICIYMCVAIWHYIPLIFLIYTDKSN